MNENEKNTLLKIKLYAKQTIGFKEGMNFYEFSNDPKTISACLFNLSQIGEAASKLCDGFVNDYNYIPWRKIKGLRNRIVHDYEGIQYNIVWDVIENFLPELIFLINELF